MRGKVLNMNDITINKQFGKLKVEYFKNPHYAYTKPLGGIMNEETDANYQI